MEEKVMYIVNYEGFVLSAHTSYNSAIRKIAKEAYYEKDDNMTDEEFFEIIIEEIDKHGCYMDAYFITKTNVED